MGTAQAKAPAASASDAGEQIAEAPGGTRGVRPVPREPIEDGRSRRGGVGEPSRSCGEVEIVDAALAEPSKAEAARQERMKREG